MNGSKNGSHLLGRPLTGGYRRQSMPFVVGAPIFGAWGSFHLGWVDLMKQDYQIELCLGYRKTPLSSAKFQVHCQDAEEKAYVEATYQRFWRKSLHVATRCYEYGYSPSEVLWKLKHGRILFDRLKAIHPTDATPWTIQGQLAAVEVRIAQGGVGSGGSVKLPGATTAMPGKGFWIAHNADWNPWWGHSVLTACWLPWRMKTMPGGLQETLFLGAYKHAISATEIRHPQGTTETEDEPAGVNYQDIAMQMGEQIKNGAILAVPSEHHPQELGGGPKWELKQSEMKMNFAPILEYADLLDKWIQRGAGIPDEVITFDQAAGSRARTSIAVGEFYDMAEQSLHHIMEAVDEQLVRPATRLNGYSGDYMVEALPLLQPEEQGAQQQGMPPEEGQPGTQTGQPAGWVQQAGPRGNPQTGAVKYGQMSRAETLLYGMGSVQARLPQPANHLESVEDKLYRTVYATARDMLKRSRRNGGKVDLSLADPKTGKSMHQLARELRSAMQEEGGTVILNLLPEVVVQEATPINNINVPAQPAPDVHIYPEAPKIPPAQVHVLPGESRAAEPDKEITVEKRGDGKWVGKVQVKTI